MAVQLTKEFWMNLIIALVTLTALGLSIWAFFAPCKSKFGDDKLDNQMLKVYQNRQTNGGFCQPQCKSPYIECAIPAWYPEALIECATHNNTKDCNHDWQCAWNGPPSTSN